MGLFFTFHSCYVFLYRLFLNVFQNNSSSSDAPEGNKLSDVVKGTARPHTRFEEKVKATPAPPSAVAATPVAVAASAPAAAPVSNADSAPASQMTSTTNTATPLTAAAVVSAVAASPVAKETEVSASPSPASHTTAPASATAVEPSAHPSKSVAFWVFSLWLIADLVMFEVRNDVADDEGCVLSHPPTHQLAFWVFCLWQIADLVMFEERNCVADDEGCVLLLYLPLTR